MPNMEKLRINGVDYDISGGGGSGSVTGVKGDKEGSYRTGNVNLTPANIGALPDTTSIPSKTSDLTNDSGYYSENDTAETTLDDADKIPFYDNSASTTSKRRNTTWSNIKTKLKTYFDTLYATVSALNNKVDKVSGKGLSTNDYTTADKNKVDSLKDLAYIAKDGTSSSTTKYLRGDGTWQAFPTIPTVNNGTLTIQKNGTNVQTFTANQSGNATANITVPTKTSELTNNSNFVVDANYVHTDNNFTNTYKNSIDNLKDLAFIAVDNTPSDMPKYLQSDGTWQEFPIATVNYAGFMANYHVQKLGTIQQGAEVNVQSDWTETDTTKDSYIQHVPDWVKSSIKPTYTSSEVGLGNVPNVATNDQKPTFTQASSRTNLVSGTDTLSTIMGKIMKWFADLKTVAFTGSYNNLIDKPTIGNGTLTVQKNGTTIDTFTANATGNKTINVTVPTKLSELTSDADHRTVTDTQIATFSGSATWGAIGGTLSNQNDLIDALNDKLDKTGGNVGSLTVENEWSSGEIEDATLLYYGIRLHYSGGPFQSAYTVYLGDTVLWTNPSPTSTFTAQTITLSNRLDSFDYIEIVARTFTTSTESFTSGLVPVYNAGQNFSCIMTAALIRNRRRTFNCDGGTSMSITACTQYSTYGSESTGTSNASIIPYRIIGFKFHH